MANDGAIGALAGFTGGLAQGVPQGFDLAERYQEIQNKRDQRRRQQEVEAVGAQIAQDGLFQKDPDKALGMMRDAYVKVGDLDNAYKFQQNLIANQDAAKKRSAGEAWERFQIGDYDGAVGLLNDIYAKDGGGTKLSYAKGADGKPTLTGLQGGQEFAKAYDDPMEFNHDLGQRFANILLGPEKAIEMGFEERKTASQERRDTAAIEVGKGELAVKQQLVESEQAENFASAAASGASATASKAAAGKYSAEAAELRDPNSPTRRKAIADAAQAEGEVKLQMADAIATDLKNNPPGGGILPTSGKTPLHQNPGAIGELALSIQGNKGNDPISARRQAEEILEKVNDVDVENGVAYIGTTAQAIGKEAAAILERQITNEHAEASAIPTE